MCPFPANLRLGGPSVLGLPGVELARPDIDSRSGAAAQVAGAADGGGGGGGVWPARGPAAQGNSELVGETVHDLFLRVGDEEVGRRVVERLRRSERRGGPRLDPPGGGGGGT